MSVMAKIEHEERRQAIEKIKKIRPDFDAVHVRYWRRITPDNGVLRGVAYSMMVIFYEEYHRELLHTANLSPTVMEQDRLLPYLDAHQIADAKQKIANGMAPFLGNGSGATAAAGTLAATTPTSAAGTAPMQRPLPQQGVPGAAVANVPQGAPFAQGTTPSQQATAGTTSLQPPFPVKPFSHVDAPPVQRGGRRGRSTWRSQLRQ